MANNIRARRRTSGTRSKVTQSSPERVIDKLTQAKLLRMPRLARWNDHRHSCDRCALVTSAEAVDATCAAGRPLMLDVMEASTAVYLLTRQVPGAPAEQMTMWDR